MTNDVLFQPFRLAGLTLRNRIVSTSHEPAYTHDGMPKDRYRRYHVEKARGGIGMTMIGGSALVSKDSPPAFGNIDMSRDEVVPWLTKLSDDVHAEGAAVMIQLSHIGQRSSNFVGDWLPLIAPSRVKEVDHRSYTKAMEDFDMDRVVADFAAAAKRASDGGLDGLELLHAGHLLDMFMVDRNNHRDDEYNGGFDDRIRFLLRVVDAVRAAVPDEFVLGIKTSVETRPNGMDEDLAVDIVNRVAEHGVQFVNLITGSVDSEAALVGQIPGMGTPSAPHLDLARRVRERVSVPLMHATRITDIATARHAVESGSVDMVGMVRAHIADPYLAVKAQEGREDDIRPCVGANACLDGIYASGSAVCVHNPATGREERLPQVIEPAAEGGRKRVVVVGAGPAGLEAARVCAVRGHEVVVFEADTAYGGQVRIAARSDRRRDLIGIADWRYQQCAKRGVDFRFGMYAEADEVLAEQPDVVIVATGGVPDVDVAAIRTPVNDVWDVMQDGLKNKKRVMVYDDNGTYPALDAVERLAIQGHEVVYVTPYRTIGIGIGEMNGPAYMRVIADHGVEMMLGERLVATAKGEGGAAVATLRSDYSDREIEVSVDAVVIENGTVPNDDLYHALRERSRNRGEVDLDAFVRAAPQEAVAGRNPQGGFALYRIGDAVSSRNIHAGILDALRLGLGV